MRRTLMVLTLPPGTRHANVDILLSAPGASERTRSSRKARDIQALRREDEQSLSRAGSVSAVRRPGRRWHGNDLNRRRTDAALFGENRSGAWDS